VECRSVSRYHIEVAAIGLDEGEQAASVDPLTTSEDGFEIKSVGDDEIEGFQLAIASRIHEIDHFDIMSLNITDDIVSGKITLWFLQESHYFVGVHCQKAVVVHIDLSVG
jgi:hypothetical protein